MVHVHDPRVRWSVHASDVMRIVAAVEWGAAPAVDIVAALGGAAGAKPATGRVVVVRGARTEIALRAAGPIEVSDVDPADILALPAALSASAPQISAIIVAHDASLSLLLEPSALIGPEDTVFGEVLCPSRS